MRTPLARLLGLLLVSSYPQTAAMLAAKNPKKIVPARQASSTQRESRSLLFEFHGDLNCRGYATKLTIRGAGRMRLLASKYFLLSVILCEIATAQQPVRDPQGLAVLNQALNAAGGRSAIEAISDFSGTGKITCYWAEPVEGTVKVRGRGLHQFRIDASISGGEDSWIINGAATFHRNHDGSTILLPSQNAVKPASITLPLLQVLSAVQDTAVGVSYGGIVKHDGQQVHDVVVQRAFQHDPLEVLGKITKAHIFVDSQTLTVQAIEDTAYAMSGPGEYPHEIQFANYQGVGGTLVPFSITELISGQKTSNFQLTLIKFNTGLSDADFK